MLGFVKLRSLFIINWYSLGGKEVFEKYLSIDIYLEEKIATLPQQTVFDEDNLAFQIYDLLGYGGLTVEIMEYLRGLLDREDKNQNKSFPVENVIDLFNRLYDFYLQMLI